MKNYYTYPVTPATRRAQEKLPVRIAVVTQGVKLGDETRGYTRFRFLSELLARQGFEVDLITSSFQHWDKAQRDTSQACYQGLPYTIRFIHEPGYKRNLDLARINSHRVFARNLRKYFDACWLMPTRAYDLIYSEIPPNDMARVCAETAERYHIPYVVDVNDLWPEAMRMALDVPLLSDLLFAPFARDAHIAYQLISAAVGTSDEYASRPAADRDKPYQKLTVYVGNRLADFDQGASALSVKLAKLKSKDEIWLTYAGTLGASYDIATLIRASREANARDARIKVKLLGDGPNRAQLEELARELSAPVEFVGYAPYDLMAAYLCASDITINSLVKSAPQSIVTKIGDYLAAGIPMINTGSSSEFRQKVETCGFGLNVEAEDLNALVEAIVYLAQNPNERRRMGQIARELAEEEFDQERSYLRIVELIDSLLGRMPS